MKMRCDAGPSKRNAFVRLDARYVEEAISSVAQLTPRTESPRVVAQRGWPGLMMSRGCLVLDAGVFLSPRSLLTRYV